MVGNRIDPENILSSSAILQKIEAVCKRHFADENEQNGSFVFIIDSLRADNFRRLRAYKGKSQLTTYIYSLVNTLIVDYRRKIYGRRRIPAGVTKLGKWAEAVYRLVCWQKFSFDDAYDFLQVEDLFEGPYEQYLKAILPIREAPCRENPAFQSLDRETSGASENPHDPDANPLEALIDKLDHARRGKALKIIRATTTALAQEDQLLIRLVYASGQPVSSVAKMIGLSASSARRRLKRLLNQYREQLLAEGIREP
ncbi:MAG: sigma-70 family RNA polymerase sigma factor [Desulfobacterales bacterium]|nr:sigma-70 family RNA polymerase sigma factor [Desulfobacterales bacterium]